MSFYVRRSKPMNLKSICVYCGSSPGLRASYLEAAEAFGRLIAAEGIRLVYGGGNVGLMGVLAKREHLASLLRGDDPRELLIKLRQYTPAWIDKWIDRKPSQTVPPTSLPRTGAGCTPAER